VSTPQPKTDSTQRFSDRVGYYIRSRPRYPRAIINLCQSELGLRPQDKIADIGSGTGFLSEPFLQNGNEVFGVEPNEAMRLAAEKILADFPKFHSLNSRAEATTLADKSIDFVIAGQAFHWFDRPRTRVEFQRILRPTGWVVLVWNEREKDTPANEFSAAYDAVVREFQIDWDTVSHEKLTNADPRELAEFFSPAEMQIREFDNPQTLDLDGVLARALSSSYLPLPGQPRCEEMLDRLREIVQRYGNNGKVVQPYTAKVYYGRLS
jgi:ubiquinone/menaquinone biosynthesis C-methylase UbiE